MILYDEEYDLNVNILDEVVEHYNHRKHRGIGKQRPIECFFGEKEPEVVYYKHNLQKPMFKIGDKVRVTIQFNKKMSENAKRTKLNSVEVFMKL